MPHAAPGHRISEFAGARNHALGLAHFRIPKYAGMTAGELVRRSGSRVCSWEDPVLAPPSPSPRCNLLFARSPGFRAMRSAFFAPSAALAPKQGPGGSHGHSSTAEEQQTGKS